jgi:hypothetical protein
MRWLLVMAVAAAFAVPRQLQAQRGSIGTRSAPTRPGGVRPAPRQPATHIRIRPGAIVLSASHARSRHRVFVFRSTVAGLFAFDPYWWLAPDVIDDDVDVAALPAELPSPGSRPKGGLQLDVEPRRALVYLDGVLAGTVDQFKGYFDHLETTAGFHVVEFLAADYDPLIVTVTVAPDRTTTYRASLNRAAGR